MNLEWIASCATCGDDDRHGRRSDLDCGLEGCYSHRMVFVLGSDKFSKSTSTESRPNEESGRDGRQLDDAFGLDFDFRGRHVLADIASVPAFQINDRNFLIETLRDGVKRSGATLLDEIVHDFTPSGFTALLLLAESHVSIHTYPDYGSLFLDAFTCGDSCDPDTIIDHFLEVVTCEVAFRRNQTRGNHDAPSHDGGSLL